MDQYNDIYQLQQTHTDVETQYGTLKYLSLGTRYGYYFKPHDKCTNLLLFYHGSRDCALNQALIETTLLKYATEYNMIVFFGQADGVLEQPTIHPIYKDINFGHLYWSIKESQNMIKDIEYTKRVIEYFKLPNVYYIGHSNGGVFSSLLAVYLPTTFRAIVNHKGGLGYDTGFYIDFDQLNDDRKTPILFFTSENDIYRSVSQHGYELFKNMDFPCELIVMPDDGHVYNSEYEKFILDWVFKK
jgi:pimeloyl-ACP methyl ester carboxylesterase